MRGSPVGLVNTQPPSFQSCRAAVASARCWSSLWRRMGRQPTPRERGAERVAVGRRVTERAPALSVRSRSLSLAGLTIRPLDFFFGNRGCGFCLGGAFGSVGPRSGRGSRVGPRRSGPLGELLFGGSGSRSRLLSSVVTTTLPPSGSSFPGTWFVSSLQRRGESSKATDHASASLTYWTRAVDKRCTGTTD